MQRQLSPTADNPSHTLWAAVGQTRPRRLPTDAVVARPVLLSKRTHFGPVGPGQPWAGSGHPTGSIPNQGHRYRQFKVSNFAQTPQTEGT